MTVLLKPSGYAAPPKPSPKVAKANAVLKQTFNSNFKPKSVPLVATPIPVDIANPNAPTLKTLTKGAKKQTASGAISKPLGKSTPLSTQVGKPITLPKGYKPASQEKSSGGGLSFGSIFNPVSDIKSVVGTAEHLPSDVVRGAKGAAKFGLDFPKIVSTGAQSLATEGASTFNALARLKAGQFTGNDPTAATDKKIVANADPIAGDIAEGSLKPTLHNPFGTALDLAGGAGLADHVAGAIGRKVIEAGIVKSPLLTKAADYAAVKRILVPGEQDGTSLIAPGIEGKDALNSSRITESREMPKGLVKNAVTRNLLENHPTAYKRLENVGNVYQHPVSTIYNTAKSSGKERKIVFDTAVKNKLRGQVSTLAGDQASEAGQAYQKLQHALNESLPQQKILSSKESRAQAGSAAANLQQALIGLPDDAPTARAELEARTQQYEDALEKSNQVNDAHRALTKGKLDNENLRNIHMLVNTGSPEGRSAQAAIDRMTDPDGPGLNSADKAAVHKALDPLVKDKVEQKAMQQNIDNLKSFTQSPNFEGVYGQVKEHAAKIMDLQDEIDRRRVAAGLQTEDQLRRRSVMAGAQQMIPGVRILPQDSQLSDYGHAANIVEAEQKQAEAEVNVLKARRARIGGSEDPILFPEHRELTAAYKNLAAKRGVAGSRTGFTQAAHGLNADVTAAARSVEGTGAKITGAKKILARHEGSSKAEANLLHAMQRVSKAKSDLNDRLTLERAQTEQAINEAQDRADIAAQHHAVFASQPQKFGGMSIEDPTRPSGFRPLSTEEAEQGILDKRNVSRTAFFSGRTPHDSETNFPTPLARGDTPGARFTGGSMQTGSFEPGVQGVAKSLMRGQHAVMNAQGWDRFIKQFGIRPDGTGATSFSKSEVKLATDDFESRTGMKAVAVPEHARDLGQDQISKISARNGGNELRENADFDHEFMNSQMDQTKDDRYVLVPKDAMDTYESHFAKPSSGGRIANKINQGFRYGVLPFSSKWYLSILGEGAIRGVLGGLNPAAHGLTEKFVASLREHGFNDDADRLETISSLGTMHNMTLRDASKLLKSTGHEAESRRKQFAQQFGSSYPRLIRKTMSGVAKIEKMQTQAVVDREMQKTLYQFTSSMADTLKGQKDAIDSIVSSGKIDQDKIIAVSQKVDHIMGQYNHFSPAEQAFIRNAAPFWPWYKNAIQFMYVTLPKDHPLLTSMLYNAGKANQTNWNKQHANAPVTNFAGIPFGDLQNDTMTGPNQYRDLARFSPLGIASYSPLQIPETTIAPVEAGAIESALGVDAFGHTQYVKDPKTGKDVAVTPGDSNSLKQILSSVIESETPASFGVRTLDAIRGIHPAESATVFQALNPPRSTSASAGLQHGSGLWNAVERVLSPVRATYYMGKTPYTGLKPSSGGTIGGGSFGSGSFGSSSGSGF